MLFSASLLLLGFASIQANVTVHQSSTLKLPDNTGALKLFAGTADAMALDVKESFLYVVGTDSDMLNVVDVSNKDNLTVVYQKHFNAVSDGVPLDVAVCRFSGLNTYSRLAVSFSDRQATYEGHVEIFDLLEGSHMELVKIETIPVQPDPKSIAWVAGCERLIVACEARAGGRADPVQFVDPPGHVVLIQLDPFGSFTVRKLNFGPDNSDIRQVYSGYTDPDMGIANDLEPEAIVIGSNNTAYVILQENNAMGSFNIYDTINPISLFDLGTKDFNKHDIDTSDIDLAESPNGDGINLQKRNIQAFYQPGDLETFVFNGEDYVITADQGAKKEYTAGVHGVDFTEAIRGHTFNAIDLDEHSLGSTTIADLSTVSRMGHLFISSLKTPSDGFDDQILNKFTSLRMYGARGFSIWRPRDKVQTYQSGGEFEGIMAQNYSSVFNGDCENGLKSPPQDMDLRSDDMGPEPSAVATALFKGKRIAVIGSGRTGTLFVYSISADGNNLPVGIYQSVHKPGNINEDWNTLYQNNNAGHPIITDMDLHENSDGSTDLYVLGGATGSITIYSVNETL